VASAYDLVAIAVPVTRQPFAQAEPISVSTRYKVTANTSGYTLASSYSGVSIGTSGHLEGRLAPRPPQSPTTARHDP
jgi:hypothetical protein